MKNIRKFEMLTEKMEAIIEEYSISYVNEENKVYTTPEHGGQGGVDYSTMYTTFEALEDGTFSFRKKGTGDDIQYSKDNGATWTSLSSGETVSVVTGDNVMWKSTITPSYDGIGNFSSSKKFNVYGNTMSLLYGDDFKGQTSLEGKDYAFNRLFDRCYRLIDTSNLILPATTLAEFCYTKMFNGCTNLTTAFELPATTLVKGCYNGTFSGCTSLTIAPELPATTLAEACYGNIFAYCSGLTTSPELPVTILADMCYVNMFKGCTNLTTAPELPATTLTYSCYYGMFEGCTNLTTAPELPATTLVKSCYQYMFRSCINLTTAPELPSTVLDNDCYDRMFKGCTSLNHIKMLATDISYSNCLNDWVGGVSSTGTFVKHPDMTSLPTGTSGIPNGWTVEDAVL